MPCPVLSALMEVTVQRELGLTIRSCQCWVDWCCSGRADKGQEGFRGNPRSTWVMIPRGSCKLWSEGRQPRAGISGGEKSTCDSTGLRKEHDARGEFQRFSVTDPWRSVCGRGGRHRDSQQGPDPKGLSAMLGSWNFTPQGGVCVSRDFNLGSGLREAAGRALSPEQLLCRWEGLRASPSAAAAGDRAEILRRLNSQGQNPQ